LAKNKDADALRTMIEAVRPFLISLGKAKAAKLVRNLVDLFLEIEAPSTVSEKERKQFQEIKVQLCQECIKWAREQNRVYLRQTLEARLVRLYNDIGRYQDAQALVNTLVKELKKMDDKDLIVEVQLEESKAYYYLNNLMKARAALTSARTTANAIYVPPKMQAALDMQSGILHAADERDFKTAFSYFYEAFEGYDSVENPEALRALKYMLLSKIMLNSPDEVTALLSAKLGMKYAGSAIDSMKAVASAAKQRSLADFNIAFGRYKDELQMDPVVKSHFQSLYDAMLEKNLCRIIEPYSRVQISHVAKAINLPEAQVEKKLSQMILDKRINGILDQNDGTLIVFDDVAVDKTYEMSLDTIHAMGKVVDALYHKAKKLT